jgi:hypothetical protein
MSFTQSGPAPPWPNSFDEAAAERLWHASADLTGLTATGVTTAGSHSPR